MLYQATKRFLDLAGSWGLWFLCAPLLLFLALLIKWKMPGPVLFRQTRPGLHGRPFTLYKLRTMTLDRDAEGCLLPDVERLTPLGSFLRSSSLDELPELINVINGEMSLVGPRPLLMAYLGRYTPEQARRHDVKPGLTGWAQVNGRNSISWQQKFSLDVWYVDNYRTIIDMRILWMTVKNVLRREGINQDGQATIQEFPGN